MSSAYMPGYAYSNYIPYSMTTMMERAFMSGLAGAAMGSMFSSPSYHSSSYYGGGYYGGSHYGGGHYGGFGGGRHR